MKITDELLRKYARVIARVGANVQPGQIVLLNAAVDQSKFAMMVMEECYLCGAKKVNMQWYCDEQERLNYTYASEETLGTVLPWEEQKAQQMVKDLPCRIFIESEDPDGLAGIDPEKMSNVSRMISKVIKPYRDAIDMRHQWCIAAIPSPKWAMKCFPGKSEEEAMQLLWDAILTTVRVSEDNDPVADWNAHTEEIEAKSKWLNSLHFSSLRYHSANGTDFTVELIPDARWEGAGAPNYENNVFYIPNMPTEEVFTSPIAGKCEGTLVATKALSWNGQLIEGFSITFENGRAVSCRAEKGEDTLKQMIAMDENSCMLGEVALVPKESPVNRCNFMFYNTLFDENACCHVALGEGFKEVLPDGDKLTVEEAQKRGINDSCIHVDFMVGSEDLEIVGICPDGTEVQIFRNGTWA